MLEGATIPLTTRERRERQRDAGARNGRADQARQARLIQWRSEGLTGAQIRAKLDCGDIYCHHFATTQRKPADGCAHGSSRKLAAELGSISHMMVTRISAKHAVRPHCVEGYLAYNDPDFEAKAAAVDQPVSIPAASRGRVLRTGDSAAQSLRPRGLTHSSPSNLGCICTSPHLVAHPCRTVIRQDRTRRHRPSRLNLGV